jgi:AcrR family transcriptional regulator
MARTRTRAEQRDATRARLLKVARKVFVRDGYDATSIARVCSEARVTHGALYHHFPSKDALFSAVVAEMFVEVGAGVSEAAASHRGWAQVEAACQAYLDACTRPDVQLLLFRDGPRVLPRDTFDGIDHSVNAPLVDGMLERWIAEGLIEPRPISLVARTIGAAFAEAGSLIRESEGSPHVRAQLEALLMTWISTLKRTSDAQPVLATERLVMRPWQSSDEDALSTLTAHPSIYRYLFDGKPPDRAWLRKATRASKAALEQGSAGLWLARNGEGEIVGFAGFVGGEGSALELVFATEPSATRRGHALEMAKAVLREASARKCPRVAATVDEANAASVLLLGKLGFVRVGRRAAPSGDILEYVLPPT